MKISRHIFQIFSTFSILWLSSFALILSGCGSGGVLGDVFGNNSNSNRKAETSGAAPDYCSALTDSFATQARLTSVRENEAALFFVQPDEKRECLYRTVQNGSMKGGALHHYPTLYLLPKLSTPETGQSLSTTSDGTQRIFTLTLAVDSLSIAQMHSLYEDLKQGSPASVARPAMQAVSWRTVSSRPYTGMDHAVFLEVEADIIAPLKSLESSTQNGSIDMTFEADLPELRASNSPWRLHIFSDLLPSGQEYYIFDSTGAWSRARKTELLNRLMHTHGASRYLDVVQGWIENKSLAPGAIRTHLPELLKDLDPRWSTPEALGSTASPHHAKELRALEAFKLYPWIKDLKAHFDRVAPLFSSGNELPQEHMQLALDLYHNRADTEKVERFLAYHARFDLVLVGHFVFTLHYWDFMESLEETARRHGVETSTLIESIRYVVEHNQLRSITDARTLLDFAYDVHVLRSSASWTPEKESSLLTFFDELHQSGDFSALGDFDDLQREIEFLFSNTLVSSEQMILLTEATHWLSGWAYEWESLSPFLSAHDAYKKAKTWIFTRKFTHEQIEMMKNHFMSAAQFKDDRSADAMLEAIETNIWTRLLQAPQLETIEKATQWLSDTSTPEDAMENPRWDVPAAYDKATFYVAFRKLGPERLESLKARYQHHRQNGISSPSQALKQAERDLGLTATPIETRSNRQ